MGDVVTGFGRRETSLPRRVVAEVRAAFALLTRVPVRTAGANVSGAAAFGLVGAVIGAAGAVPVVILGGSEPLLTAVAGVAVMALLSGALHLDGLADTADALLVADRARAEQARKDPAVGLGGVVTLVLVIGAQVAALSSIASGGVVLAAAACVVAGTVSRVVPVVVPSLVGGGVTTNGLGAWFVARVGTADVIIALISGAGIVAAASLIAGSGIPAIGAVGGGVVGLLVGRAIVRLRGQLDGDGLGASVELALAATLAACAIATP